ncbi:GIY-YIG nuclease family protein [Dethiothermospora halolimnae]|uniref:GIY-YIG nuclease family protein n=1 Tax=Dethiothermospora halolimnae TaxID=3114390 RepID=UPI003CCBC217
MAKKLSLEEVKELAISKGYKPLFKDYKNNKQKLLLETKEGYKVLGCYDKMAHRNAKPSAFGNGNPYTIENIKLWLKRNNKPFKLISTEYKNNSEKLTLSCPIHGEFRMSWTVVQRGSNCPKCAIGKLKKDRKLKIEDVKSEFIKRGFKPLFDKYNNNKEVLKYKDRKGYKYQTSVCNLRYGKEQHKFSPNNPYSYENILLWFSKNQPNYKFTSKEFIGTHEKYNFECHKGHRFNMTLKDFIHGEQRCPICARKLKHGDGGYNTTKAERNKKEWLKLKVKVYIIECWNYEEHFYKIGITRNLLKKRFSGEIMPYDYKILDTVNTNLYDAIYLEKELHEKNRKFQYKPKIWFRGHTECFSKLYNKELEVP